MIKSPLLPLSPNGNIPPKINPFSGHHYSNYKYYKESSENLSSVTKNKRKIHLKLNHLMQLKGSQPRPNPTSQNTSLLLLVRIVDSPLKFGNLEVFCSLKQFTSYSAVFVPKHNILLDYIAAFPFQLSGGKARPF